MQRAIQPGESAVCNVSTLLRAWSDEEPGALARLTPVVYDRRKVQVVEVRFFGGLSVEKTSEVIKVPPVTVIRDWSTAKGWLYKLGGMAIGFQPMEASR